MDLDVSTTAKFKPAPATDLADHLVSTPEVEVRDDRKRPRRSVITTIATTASRRWKATLAFFVVVVLAGGYSFGYGLDREGFPPINTPISIVTGTYFVDDIDQVDTDVTQPLIDAFADVDGVVSTEAQARPSSFVVVVEFEDSLGSEEGTQRLVDLGVDLGDDVTSALTIDYRAVNAAKFVNQFDVLVSVVGPAAATPADLQEQADILAIGLQETSQVEVAEVRDLITESDDESRITRFTRVALDSSGYEEAISVGLIRAESSDLDVLEFTDFVNAQIAANPLDDGYAAVITADFATGVDRQLSSLTGNLLTGLLAVALVSLR